MKPPVLVIHVHCATERRLTLARELENAFDERGMPGEPLQSDAPELAVSVPVARELRAETGC